MNIPVTYRLVSVDQEGCRTVLGVGLTEAQAHKIAHLIATTRPTTNLVVEPDRQIHFGSFRDQRGAK